MQNLIPHEGIIPALAGNTPQPTGSSNGYWDHPRSRGEYSPTRIDSAPGTGSSPLSRGIPIIRYLNFKDGRIIPALAGNTTAPAGTTRTPRDHPRSRGEYPTGGNHMTPKEGSSPLSRGIRTVCCWRPWSPGIIPALAGNTGSGSGYSSASRDHPRSRGEYHSTASALTANAGSSPLSRGILWTLFTTFPTIRIIPALAGNTTSPYPQALRTPDHPRSRGEYILPNLC